MRKVAFLILTLLSLAGCSVTFEAGIERTPAATPTSTRAPDRLQPTLEALRSENQRLIAALTAQPGPATATPPPPDLGRIAYVQGGDIWVKSLPAGQPARLTSDGRNSEPRWSPSGRWLAFRKDRTVILQEDCDMPKPQREFCRESVWQEQLWLVETSQGTGEAALKTLRQLNEGLTVKAFAWSPVCDRLAYVDAFGSLRVVDGDSGRTSALLSKPRSDVVGAIAWSPDGASIAFEYARSRAGAEGPEHGLWRISPDGGEPSPLYIGATAGQSEPRLAAWSPTGRGLLFWQDDGQPAISADGAPLFGIAVGGDAAPAGEPARVDTAPTLLHAGFLAPAPAGSLPGAGEWVAVVAGAGAATWQDKQIVLTRALPQAGNSPELSLITPDDEAATSPAWSPDGAWLAYSAMPERAGLELDEAVPPELMQRRIWVRAAGASTRRKLTDSPGYRDEFPLWSRDGSTLLFARLDAAGRASLWIVPAAGGPPQQMVGEITPAPDPLGAFGHISWPQFFDWTRGSAP